LGFIIGEKTTLIEKAALYRWKQIFPKGELIQEVYTPYQYLDIARLKNQIIVLSNGKVIEALPDKNSGYEMAALFISMLDLPKDILIFGYGSENTIRYLTDFPVQSISYVIPDKDYFNLVKKYAPRELNNIYKDGRVKFIFKDPRVYLTNTDKKYDLIVANIPDANTAHSNKYYTDEFYKLIKTRLKTGGAVATKITSAENFIGSEIRNYGSSIYYTLKNTFEKIIIIPGEINWFFAGNKDSTITQKPETLAQRYRRYMTVDSTFYPEAFHSLLPKDRVKFLKETYENNSVFKNGHLINSDKKPLSYFLNILVLARYSNSHLVKILKEAFFSGWILFLFPIILFLILRLHFLKYIANETEGRAVFNSKTFQLFCGASAFTFHLTLLFLFQNRFGTLFLLIGLVNSLFMLGLFTGSLISKKLIQHYTALKLIFLITAIQTLLYATSFPILENILPFLSGKASFSIYIFLFFISGTLAGSSYPLAGKVLQDKNIRLLNMAGSLEALDHWGASLAAIITGIILIPLLGIYKTLLLLSVLSLAVFMLIGLEIFKLTFKSRELQPRKLSFPYVKTSYILFATAVFAIFTFNYIENKKAVTISPHKQHLILQKLIKLDKIEAKDRPIPYYIGYRGKKKYYIFESHRLNTSCNGFGGPIDIILVVDEKQYIKNIFVSKHNEETDYFDKTRHWLTNFEGKKITDFIPPHKAVDALTGATFTSNAIIATVNKTAALIAKDIFAQKIPRQRKESAKGIRESLIMVLFVITGLFLFHTSRSRKIRFLYLVFLIVVIGFVFNIQLSAFNIFNLSIFQFPQIKNLSLFLLVFLPLVLGIFYGRIYCGWLCPFGALQEILGSSKLSRSPSKKFDARARYIKYILLTILIVLLAITRNTSIYKQEPLTRAFRFFSSSPAQNILLFSALFFSLFFLRFWCRYFCIVGAFLSLFNKIAILRPLFRKRLLDCDLNVRNISDLDCLHCNRCLKNEKR